MRKPTLSIIGAGRAGGSLARSWHNQGGFEVIALYTRSNKQRLAKTLAAQELKKIEDIPASDALMIATSDQSIAGIAQQLAAARERSWHNQVVFHLSGALPASVLEPLEKKGARIASAHPARAFSHDQTDLEGTLVGLEGQAEAIDILRPAFDAIGASCFTIDSSQKTSYHAAAVIASNHLIALADASQKLWQQSGIDSNTAKLLFESLTTGVISNLKIRGPADALTGPIARGDVQTIASHKEILGRGNLEIDTLYSELSRYLINAVELKHSDRQKQELLESLKTTQAIDHTAR